MPNKQKKKTKLPKKYTKNKKWPCVIRALLPLLSDTK